MAAAEPVVPNALRIVSERSGAFRQGIVVTLVMHVRVVARAGAFWGLPTDREEGTGGKGAISSSAPVPPPIPGSSMRRPSTCTAPGYLKAALPGIARQAVIHLQPRQHPITPDMVLGDQTLGLVETSDGHMNKVGILTIQVGQLCTTMRAKLPGDLGSGVDLGWCTGSEGAVGGFKLRVSEERGTGEAPAMNAMAMGDSPGYTVGLELYGTTETTAFKFHIVILLTFVE